MVFWCVANKQLKVMWRMFWIRASFFCLIYQRLRVLQIQRRRLVTTHAPCLDSQKGSQCLYKMLQVFAWLNIFAHYGSMLFNQATLVLYTSRVYTSRVYTSRGHFAFANPDARCVNDKKIRLRVEANSATNGFALRINNDSSRMDRSPIVCTHVLRVVVRIMKKHVTLDCHCMRRHTSLCGTFNIEPLRVACYRLRWTQPSELHRTESHVCF